VTPPEHAPDPAATAAGIPAARAGVPAGTASGDPAAAPDQASQAAGADRPRGAWSDPRLPWGGHPRAGDIVLWVGITVSGLYYLALLPFRAELVGTHPVLGELLNGSTEAIVAAAAFARVGHGTLAVAVLAAIPGLMDFDALYWWAGRRWGDGAIAMLSARRKTTQRHIARAHRWGRKFTWPAVVLARFLPIPSAILYIIAGWTGMGLVTFLILDLISSLLWTGMLAGLGYALGHHAVVVAQTISHYGLWFTLVIVALIIFSQVRAARARRGALSVRAPDSGGQPDGP
jgi:membrane-associated protein